MSFHAIAGENIGVFEDIFVICTKACYNYKRLIHSDMFYVIVNRFKSSVYLVHKLIRKFINLPFSSDTDSESESTQSCTSL